jgi:hypothetical protein
MSVRPVILLGAARSGTKLLRGILAAHPRLGAVPYDINYVWTLGQHRLGHDQLDPASLTEETREFIRDFVDRFAQPGSGPGVIEKTVSNTLRVPFVEAVFPEALYVEIVRDGRDVAASAREQWLSRSSSGAILTKLKTFPIRHAWQYGVDYLGGYLGRLVPGRTRMACWGPRYEGIAGDLERLSLVEVCAHQWSRCVSASRQGLTAIPADRVHHLKYEDLVGDTEASVGGVLDFLGMELEPAVTDFCRDQVSHRNIGKWRSQMTSEETELVLTHLGEELVLNGYE